MTRQPGSTMTVVRFVILTAVVALFAMTVPARVGAQEDDESYDNTIIQISMCELAGGDAEVGQLMTGGGFYATSVSCNGGLLDGMECGNTPDHGSDCHWRDDEVSERIRDSENDYSGRAGDISGIKAEEGPVETPVVIVEPVQPVEVVEPDVSDGGEPVAPEATEEPTLDQPTVSDDTTTPTPEPGGEVIVDPVIDDAVIDDLEVSGGGAVAPEVTAEPIVLEPETGGKTIDGIDISIPIEDHEVIVSQ